MGSGVGAGVGSGVGTGVGAGVETEVGFGVGSIVGAVVGSGAAVGFTVGLAVGLAVGLVVGLAVGEGEADAEGEGEAFSRRDEPGSSTEEPQAEKIRMQSIMPSREDRECFIINHSNHMIIFNSNLTLHGAAKKIESKSEYRLSLQDFLCCHHVFSSLQIRESSGPYPRCLWGYRSRSMRALPALCPRAKTVVFRGSCIWFRKSFRFEANAVTHKAPA